jgi:hypothetical protein
MTDGRQPSGWSGGANEGWAVVGTLFAGGIGWLIDLWLDTTFVKAIGVLVGLATAIYLVVVKYGKTG